VRFITRIVGFKSPSLTKVLQYFWGHRYCSLIPTSSLCQEMNLDLIGLQEHAVCVCVCVVHVTLCVSVNLFCMLEIFLLDVLVTALQTTSVSILVSHNSSVSIVTKLSGACAIPLASFPDFVRFFSKSTELIFLQKYRTKFVTENLGMRLLFHHNSLMRCGHH